MFNQHGFWFEQNLILTKFGLELVKFWKGFLISNAWNLCKCMIFWRNWMAWNDIPKRLQPLEFEAHIGNDKSHLPMLKISFWCQQQEMLTWWCLRFRPMRRWRIRLWHLKKNRGTLEWFQNLRPVWSLFAFSFFCLWLDLLTFFLLADLP